MDVDRPVLLGDAAFLQALEQQVVELAVGLRLLLEHLELDGDLVAADRFALAGLHRLGERALLLLGDLVARLQRIDDVADLLPLEFQEVLQLLVQRDHLGVLRPVFSGLHGALPDQLHLLVLHGDDDRVHGDLGDAVGGVGALREIERVPVLDFRLDALVGGVGELGTDLAEALAAEVLRLAAVFGFASGQREAVLFAVLLDRLLGRLHPLLGLLDLLVEEDRGGLRAFDPEAKVPVDVGLGDGVRAEGGQPGIDRFEADLHDPAVADRRDLQAPLEGPDEFIVLLGLHRREGFAERGLVGRGNPLLLAADQLRQEIGSPFQRGQQRKAALFGGLVFGVPIQVQAADHVAGDRAGLEDLVLGLVEVLAGRVDREHLLRGEDVRVGALDEDLGGGAIHRNGGEQVDDRRREDDQQCDEGQPAVLEDRQPVIPQVHLFDHLRWG